MQYYAKSLIPNYNTKLDAHHNSTDVLRRLYQATSLTKYVHTSKVVCLFTRYPEPQLHVGIESIWNASWRYHFLRSTLESINSQECKESHVGSR